MLWSVVIRLALLASCFVKHIPFPSHFYPISINWMCTMHSCLLLGIHNITKRIKPYHHRQYDAWCIIVMCLQSWFEIYAFIKWMAHGTSTTMIFWSFFKFHCYSFSIFFFFLLLYFVSSIFINHLKRRAVTFTFYDLRFTILNNIISIWIELVSVFYSLV